MSASFFAAVGPQPATLAAESSGSFLADIADGLSRGGAQLADALRIAAGAGVRVERLQADSLWRDTSALLKVAKRERSRYEQDPAEAGAGTAPRPQAAGRVHAPAGEERCRSGDPRAH